MIVVENNVNKTKKKNFTTIKNTKNFEKKYCPNNLSRNSVCQQLRKQNLE